MESDREFNRLLQIVVVKGAESGFVVIEAEWAAPLTPTIWGEPRIEPL
jgi:hypothetical protein